MKMNGPFTVFYMGYYIQWTRGPGTEDPGTRGPGTQGPKLACTVHVHTVTSSLGEYPGPPAFRNTWACVSN